jgi:TRAP-type mannitol/chloroaromatic compound transport system substrate-binding protein
MDRRNFIITGGAAAAAVSASALSDTAAKPELSAVNGATGAIAAPAHTIKVYDLVMGSAFGFDHGPVGAAAAQLARRIGTASGGRFRITRLDTSHDSALTAVMIGDADIAFGTEHHNIGYQKAFGYFAGLPFYAGLAPEAFQAWLTVGGGQSLWDDLAADYNVKPLLAGHTGRSPGLWLMRSVASAADFKGQAFAVPGLARDVVRALGGEPVAVSAGRIGDAFAGGRILGAETGGPFTGMMTGLHAHAKVHVGQGINNGGSGYALGIRRTLWETMTAADQALFELCAAEATRNMLAETTALDGIARTVLTSEHGVRFERFSGDLICALAQAADDVVADAAASDGKARRINDSFMAFREQLTGLAGPNHPAHHM